MPDLLLCLFFFVSFCAFLWLFCFEKWQLSEERPSSRAVSYS